MANLSDVFGGQSEYQPMGEDKPVDPNSPIASEFQPLGEDDPVDPGSPIASGPSDLGDDGFGG
jgi:hypothetical protein